jgi:hypothetical protein
VSTPNTPADPVERAVTAEPLAPQEPVTDDELDNLNAQPVYTDPIEDLDTPGEDQDDIYEEPGEDEITEENYEQFLPDDEEAKQEGYETDRETGTLTDDAQQEWDEPPPDEQDLSEADTYGETPETPAEPTAT